MGPKSVHYCKHQQASVPIISFHAHNDINKRGGRGASFIYLYSVVLRNEETKMKCHVIAIIRSLLPKYNKIEILLIEIIFKVFTLV